MRIFHSLGHVLGGTLLIAGTTIGVGMLALPIATGEAGFWPSISVYLLCWFFMLCTGLLLLEVCQWMPKDSNLITMAHKLLGPWGKGLCWVVYLFLFITVMIAHVAGGGDILVEMTSGALPRWSAAILYVLLFSPIVYLGTNSVDRLNLILMSGVVISYLLFIFFSYNHVNTELLQRANWSKAWLAIPILFTAFTYQVIIPTLMTYMNRDVKKVRKTIIMGTTIPLVVYLVWEILILGVVPLEALQQANILGQNAVWPLKQIVGSSLIFNVGKSFAFFTMTTSYIALALAYLDFLADGLKVKKTGNKKLFLCLLVFLPPLLISMISPNIFLTALSFAGGFSCAILFGLLPPVMVWMGRYVKKISHGSRQLPGGKGVLFLLIFFILLEIFIELFQEVLNKIL
ncbi:MAG: tyrosine transporter [Chlamydiae bacterium]|nr:tyrosine transporter [Chlamydiota bacterium]